MFSQIYMSPYMKAIGLQRDEGLDMVHTAHKTNSPRQKTEPEAVADMCY